MGLEAKFMVPYQRNPHFKGRKNLLANLHSKLCETLPDQYNHRLALCGLGGVGKTQLALEYVYSQDIYERVYWISGVSEATLLSGFYEIAERTHIAAANLKPSEAAKHVLAWLNSQERWLLVIDNLDDVSVVHGYLPNLSSGHTLITTRNQHFDDIPAGGLEVSVLDVDDASAVLLALSKTADTPSAKDEAAKIVKELGYLPLAIEQAAAYIREASKNIYEFLASYQKNRQSHHARVSKGNRIYKESVATTWRLSFQQIEQNSDASKLLRLLAFLNPDGIFVDFLEAGKKGLDTKLQELVSDRCRLYEALSDLERFSLCRRQQGDRSAERITIHRLVQSVIKDEMPPETFSAMTAAVIGLCDSAFPSSWSGDDRLQLIGRRYQDQVILPLSAIEMKSRELGAVLERVGNFLRDEGKWHQAAELLGKAVDVLSVIEGYEDRLTLSAMRNLAVTCRVLGRLKDASKLSEKVLEFRKRLSGEQHPDTLSAMGTLAVTYRMQGRLGDAVKINEEVLEVTRRLLGEEHPNTLRAMGNIAGTYRDLRRWEEAVSLQEKVLELSMRVLGQDDPETLLQMSNMAMTHLKRGRLKEAAELGEIALEASTRIRGEERPETVWQMRNLAIIYREQGRFGESITLLERASNAFKGILGDEHPETLITIANLGKTYQKHGRLEDSIAVIEKTAERMKRISCEHPTVLRAMIILADVYREHGRVTESIKLYENVVDARKKILGEDHPDTIDSLDSLEEAYRYQVESKSLR